MKFHHIHAYVEYSVWASKHECCEISVCQSCKIMFVVNILVRFPKFVVIKFHHIHVSQSSQIWTCTFEVVRFQHIHASQLWCGEASPQCCLLDFTNFSMQLWSGEMSAYSYLCRILCMTVQTWVLWNLCLAKWQDYVCGEEF